MFVIDMKTLIFSCINNELSNHSYEIGLQFLSLFVLFILVFVQFSVCHLFWDHFTSNNLKTIELWHHLFEITNHSVSFDNTDDVTDRKRCVLMRFSWTLSFNRLNPFTKINDIELNILIYLHWLLKWLWFSKQFQIYINQAIQHIKM